MKDIKNKICALYHNGYNQRGEYTGYSKITNLYYISLYNGEVVKLKNLDKVIFDDGRIDKEELKNIEIPPEL